MAEFNIYTGLLISFVSTILFHIVLYVIYKKWIVFKEYLVVFFILWFIYYFWELSLWILIHYYVWYELWQYNDKLLSYTFWYSSIWSIFSWGLYAGLVYHIKRIYNFTFLKFIIFWGVFAIVLEYLLNTISLAIYWEYIFYYLPWDLSHKTTIVALPIYMFAMVSIYYIHKVLEKVYSEQYITIFMLSTFLWSITFSISKILHNIW